MIKSRIDSVKHALNGWRFAFRSEINMRIHVIVMIIVICVSFYFDISHMEWVAIIFVIGLVMIAELVNTAIEELCDHLHPDKHPKIKKVKDVSAGAVLLAAVISIIVGVLIFLPYVKSLLH